jgi:hypothetical protein
VPSRGSGSTSGARCAPSLALLAEQIQAEDRIAFVVYAGTASLPLPSTTGGDKETVIAASDRLQAGGTTAGAAGIRVALPKKNSTNSRKRVDESPKSDTLFGRGVRQVGHPCRALDPSNRDQ